MEAPKSLIRRKSKDGKKTMAEFISAHRHSQAKCQLVQTRYIKTNYIGLFCHIINILLTELSWSVRENLDLVCVYSFPASRGSFLGVH